MSKSQKQIVEFRYLSRKELSGSFSSLTLPELKTNQPDLLESVKSLDISNALLQMLLQLHFLTLPQHCQLTSANL